MTDAGTDEGTPVKDYGGSPKFKGTLNKVNRSKEIAPRGSSEVIKAAVTFDSSSHLDLRVKSHRPVNSDAGESKNENL